MFEGLSIRVAQAQDLEVIAHLSIQTFRDTFETNRNTADIESYLQSHFQTEQISAELADNKNTFLLACPQGSSEPIGYAKLRVGQAEACITGSKPIELERLYVDQAAIGQGVGAELMRDCLSKATLEKHDILWLGVWENNSRAIKFYERWSFTTVGSHVFRLGSDDQNDLIMQRSVLVAQ